MDIRDRRGLKKEAGRALAAASCDPKKLILIHTGASVALALVLALLDYVLEQQIGGTGGLSGIGLRSVLETMQTVLMFGQVAALLFWQIGYIFVALRISRGEEVSTGSLLQGFRKFGPVLRLRIIVSLLYAGLFLVSSYVASMIFSLTPWATPMVEAIELGTEEALLAAMDACMVPLALVLLGVLAILGLPYYYRLRMTEFALMDDPRAGAMAAIRKSRMMMRRNRTKLFALDLSFWWYYLLEMLVGLIAYGDLLLPTVGVSLPWSATTSYYVFLVLCYLGQLVLYWWRGNEVQVTYAMAYQSLMPNNEKEMLP